MVIRICVCTHSFIQHQRLPYGEQPCHSNITGPYSSHPSPRMLLPQHLHTAACWEHCGTSVLVCCTLAHPQGTPGTQLCSPCTLHRLRSDRSEAGAELPQPHAVPSAVISCTTAGLIHSPSPAPCHWQSRQ